MPPVQRRLVALAAAVLLSAEVGGLSRVQSQTPFAEKIAELSEPGGYFNSDNLISNERSYLHVIPSLREAGLGGGAYLGVGPDQNFSYIAHTRPSIAFIIDIRRDNLLLHLLLKAIFHLSGNRAEYLSLLFGRPAPGPADAWTGADIERIASYVDATPPSPATAALRERVDAVIREFGVPLSKDDLATIDRFHRVFIDRGLELRFESAGRPPRSYYPTYRELLLETDRTGRRWNYLASESDYQFVRSLEERDLVVPVVGNLAGTVAMDAIGRFMNERGDHLSAIYTSNVEFYLSNHGELQRFITNLARLPHTGRSLIIRSVFPNMFGWVDTTPGYHSASVVQRVDDLLDGAASGRIRDYRDLIKGR